MRLGPAAFHYSEWEQRISEVVSRFLQDSWTRLTSLTLATLDTFSRILQ